MSIKSNNQFLAVKYSLTAPKLWSSFLVLFCLVNIFILLFYFTNRLIMRIITANTNPIHFQIEHKCRILFDSISINKKDDLNLDVLQEVKPDFIFFLHWSSIIPKAVHEKFNCIVFHMTDLPYGRGGSPLQNLIIRGFEETVISALKVQDGIDTGPILLKKRLSLAGTAEEIFLRAGKKMMEMIVEIIQENPKPIRQQGDVVIFKRRKPEESNIQLIKEKEKLYDFIRMLDAEGYPRAFIETEFFKFEFSRASLKTDSITAEVKIIEKS